MADDLSVLQSATSSAASTSNSTATSNLAENFDTFLTILTTQLQNQDPLSPLDTHEFTNQLVMFAGAEQSVKQSGLLEDLIDLNKSNEAIGAVSYLGTTVEIEGNTFNYEDGDNPELAYELSQNAQNAAIQIFDSFGRLTKIEEVPNTSGRHTFTWDGTNDLGQDVSPGQYSFLIGAVDGNDVPVPATTFISGRVNGIETSNGNTTLDIDGVSVPVESVRSIRES